MSVAAKLWSPEALAEALAERAGGRVRVAGDKDAVAGVRPAVVVEPATEDEVAAVMAFADGERLKVLIRGGGTQLGQGYPPTGGDILLSMGGLNRVVEHEPGDMTATAEAGLTLDGFQEALGKAGQWLALDPTLPPAIPLGGAVETRAMTIGGIVATAASGAHRLRYGGVRDQIIGVRIVRADGTIAKGGGKVVKNVAGFDLPKLFTGSLGTLGVIVAATFRLYPRAASSRTVALVASEVRPLCDLAVKIIATTLVPSALDITGSTRGGEAMMAVRFEGSEEACEEQSKTLLALANSPGLRGHVMEPAEEINYWRGATYELSAGTAEGTILGLKVSLLPADVAAWLDALREQTGRVGATAAWRAHAGHGLITVTLVGAEERLPALVMSLRAAAVARKGSLVVTSAPPAIAGGLDPWGESPALGLMRRVKEEFDPHGTLNPGRFVGGI